MTLYSSKFNYVVLFLPLLIWGSACAQEYQRPGPTNSPTRVETQVLLLDLDDISGAEQQFIASVYLSFRWHDPRLAGRWPDSTVRPLGDIWHPGLLVVNQKFLLRGLDDAARVDPDGTVSYTQRIWGNFSQRMNLREFPMDSHAIDIVIVATRGEVGEIVFVEMEQAPSGLSDELSVTGWEVSAPGAAGFQYQPTTSTEPVPAFRFRFTAKRHVGYYLLKMVLPMILIVAMSWLVFWIDPGETGTQISVAVTSMLTLIAYQFLVSDLLPAVSYMTRLDGFILAATILVFASLIEVIVISRLAASNQVSLALRIDIACRVAFPVMFVVLLAVGFLRY